MELPIRAIEEIIDHAARVRALAQLCEQVKGTQAKLQVAALLSKQLTALELEHARTLNSIASRLLDVYQASVDQRYTARKIFRVLTLSLSAGHDRDKAAAGARAEITELLHQLREVQVVQQREAVLQRARLLALTTSDQRHLEEALFRLLHAFAPEDMEYLRECLARRLSI